mgnify:CR=1 FL=1|jgi:hypothetical protein
MWYFNQKILREEGNMELPRLLSVSAASSSCDICVGCAACGLGGFAPIIVVAVAIAALS